MAAMLVAIWEKGCTYYSFVKKVMCVQNLVQKNQHLILAATLVEISAPDSFEIMQLRISSSKYLQNIYLLLINVFMRLACSWF